MSTYKGWEYELPETVAACEKHCIRHEIVHAFLSESGLADSSFPYDSAWAATKKWLTGLHRKVRKSMPHGRRQARFDTRQVMAYHFI